MIVYYCFQVATWYVWLNVRFKIKLGLQWKLEQRLNVEIFYILLM